MIKNNKSRYRVSALGTTRSVSKNTTISHVIFSFLFFYKICILYKPYRNTMSIFIYFLFFIQYSTFIALDNVRVFFAITPHTILLYNTL